MAYLDFDLRMSTGSAGTAAPPAALDPLEVQAILASRRDGLRPLADPGRLERAARLVCGIRPARRLANARLEAMRRYAVLYRIQGDGMAASEHARALADGITAAHAARIRALVDAWRPAVPRRGRAGRSLLLVVMAMLSGLTLTLWNIVTGDGLVSAMLGGLLLVILLPPLLRDGRAR